MYKFFITLFLFTASAAASENEHLDISTQIEDGKGDVIIIQDKDGKKETFKESFKVDDNTDVDKVVAELLNKHGIDMPPPKPPGHAWIKSTENIDVEVIDNMAIIRIKKNDGGNVEVIEETRSLDGDVELEQYIEDILKKHGIDDLHNKGHKIIQIDKQALSNKDQGAYFGFMASVENDGWHVVSVIPDSGAAKAGLQDDDVIISVDGQKTDENGLKLNQLGQQVKVNETVEFKVLRKSQQKTLQVTAGKLSLSDALIPPEPPLPPSVKYQKSISHTTDGSPTTHVIFLNQKLNKWLGDDYQLITVNPGLKSYFGTAAGVLLINVSENNPLGLVEGDVLLQINGKDVTTPEQAIKALAAIDPKSGYDIEVMRKKEKISIAS